MQAQRVWSGLRDSYSLPNIYLPGNIEIILPAYMLPRFLA